MTDVITTRREGGILEVTLDRPKANAIDLKTSRLMGETFKAFRDDPELRVVFMSGSSSEDVTGLGIPFLAKPFNPSSLSRVIRDELDQAKRSLSLVPPRMKNPLD